MTAVARNRDPIADQIDTRLPPGRKKDDRFRSAPSILDGVSLADLDRVYDHIVVEKVGNPSLLGRLRSWVWR